MGGLLAGLSREEKEGPRVTSPPARKPWEPDLSMLG